MTPSGILPPLISERMDENEACTEACVVNWDECWWHELQVLAKNAEA